MSDTTEVAQLKEVPTTSRSIFASTQSFEKGQRMAQLLASSSIVPHAYQNNIPNCMVALEMAGRMRVSPLMVMQNLDIIKGKPSWSGAFVISVINACGRFTPLRFKYDGQQGSGEFGYRAVTTDIETGDRLIGPKVTWDMVKQEGWYGKRDSKWKTMPELMFHYRCASFFGRIYCPDILMGMHSVEEVIDIQPVVEITSHSEKVSNARIVQSIAEAKDVRTLQNIKDTLIEEDMYSGKIKESVELKMKSLENKQISIDAD